MTAQEQLGIERRGGVVVVRLGWPESGNALGLSEADALLAAVRSAERDEDCVGIAFTAAGRVFCGGGDVVAMAEAPDAGDYLDDLVAQLGLVTAALASTRLVVVSAIQGSVAGAGLIFPLLSDLVVASASARFSSAYAGVGLTPDCGVSYLLPRVVGERRAARLALFGEALDATTAAEWGLVDRVVPPEALDGELDAVLARLQQGATQVLAPTKRLVRTTDPAALAARLELERRTIVELARHPDAIARLRRFARA